MFDLDFEAYEAGVFEDAEFVIDNDAKAEWAIRKIAEIRAESDRMIEVSKQYIDFYNGKIEAEHERCEQRCNGLVWMLKAYFATVPHKETKTQQSYALPSGRLLMKVQQPEIKRDDEALTKWMKSNYPEFVEVKESPKWGDFKKTVTLTGTDYVTEHGEIVPGISVTPREPLFTVDLK